MSNFAKICITSDSPLGKWAKIEVNGQDLSSHLRSVHVDLCPDSIIVAHLEVIVSDLEIDGPGVVEIERVEEC